MKDINNSITWEVDSAIGILTINDPPGNEIQEPDFVDIATLKPLFDDPAVKGIIITSKGRHFSSGANPLKIKEYSQTPELLYSKITAGQKLLSFISSYPLPKIAVIKGVCFGAGLEIALTCDIRYASKNTVFAFPETGMSLIPGMQALFRLPGIIGSAKTLEMILSGSTCDADSALAYGLIDEITEEKDPLKKAMEFLVGCTTHRKRDVIEAVSSVLFHYRYSSYEDALSFEAKQFCNLAYREMKRNES